MCRIKICVMILFILTMQLFLQDVKASDEEAYLVKLKGKILDASTLEPVSAKLTYKIIPSGNITGIRMFANDNGEYLVQLQKYHQYTIEVSSEEYLPVEISLKTDDNKEIQNDFHLYKIPQKGEVFGFSDKIYFDRGKFTINENSTPILDVLADIMMDHPDMKIRLEGHTDKGSLRSLFHLSEDRVEEVKRYLVEEKGIHKRRVKTKAYGGTRPISDESTTQARKENRRVEVRVIQL